MKHAGKTHLLALPAIAAASQRWSMTWFELDPQGRLVLDGELKLHCANPAGQRLLDSGMVAPHAGNRLRFLEPASNRAFQQHAALALSRDEPVAALILPFGAERWVAVTIIKTTIDDRWALLVTMDDISPCTMIDASIAGKMFGLSPAELAIFQGIADAICPKEMARMLNISVSTVRAHLRAIYAKLSVRNSSQAQRLALSLSMHVQTRNSSPHCSSGLFN